MKTFLSLGRLKIMIGGSIKVEEALKKQLFDLLEMDMEEKEKVNHYLIDHDLSKFFSEYEVLTLSSSTNQKIETIKMLIE